MFNPETALNLAKKYARPRLAGTTRNDEVADDIGQFLLSCGYQVTYPKFNFTSALGTFITAELLIGAALIITALWIRQSSVLLSAVPALLLLALLAFIPRINRAIQENSISGRDKTFLSGICARFGKNYKTKNIVATLTDEGNNDSRTEVILMAHHDSKSQKIPLILRMILFGIVFIAGFLFPILILLSIFFNLDIAVLTVSVLVLAASVPLLFIDVGNDSLGAIDNASGVATVLHLAEVLKEKEEILENIKITILITGAEEFGTMGAEAYVQENLDRLNLQAETAGLYVLHFEGVGVDGNMFLVNGDKLPSNVRDGTLSKMIQEAGMSLNYPLRNLLFVGALLDHQPFSKWNFNAATILGFGKDSWFIHTQEDKPERLSVEGFDKAGRITLGVLQKISGLTSTHECGLKEVKTTYKADPFLKLIRDRLRMTPSHVFYVALFIGFIDLLIGGFVYKLWISDSDRLIIGALQDPPYLLTMFIIIPLLLRTYVWLPEGLWELIQSLKEDNIILPDEYSAYEKNVSELIFRYDRKKTTIIAFGIAILFQFLVYMGNASWDTTTYNTMESARLFFLRIPYGILTFYAATATLMRYLYVGNWRVLLKGINLQINPQHPDRAAGYGVFTKCSMNMMGFLAALSLFLLTKILFQSAPDKIAFQPEYQLTILAAFSLAFLVGAYIILYRPMRVTQRFIGRAKRRELEKISKRYFEEQQTLLGSIPDSNLDDLTKSNKLLEELKKAQEQIEKVPDSPFNKEALRAFGLTSLSIPLYTAALNLIQFIISGPDGWNTLGSLLSKGPPPEILQGILQVLISGKINGI